jgi:hypothetical protein
MQLVVVQGIAAGARLLNVQAAGAYVLVDVKLEQQDIWNGHAG